MGNALEFVLKLRDMLTPAMRAAAGVADSVAGRIQAGMDRARNSSRTFSASIDEMRARLDAVNKVRFGTRIKAEFDEATRSARKLEAEIERLENRGKKSSGGSAVSNLFAAVSAASILAFGGSSVKSAMDFGAQQKTYEVMTGSAARGQQLSAELRYQKENTIMGASVYQNAQTMMGFGISDKEVIRDLRMIGDIAMGNKDRMASLTLAFSQTQAAGRLMGQDLLQYINAGFNPLGVMAEKWQEFGFKQKVSVGQLKDMMSEGDISAAMVKKAFEVATGAGGRYHNMMNVIAKTSAGQLMLLEGHFAAFKIDLGNALMPLAKLLMDGATGALHFFKAILDGEPAAVTAAVIITGLAVALNGASIASKAAALWQGILNAVMNANPIILVITLLIALGVWIWRMTEQNKNWADSFKALWEIIKSFGRLTVLVFKGMWENISFFVEMVWLKTKDFFQWFSAKMQNIGEGLNKMVHLDFKGAFEAVSRKIDTSASKEIEQRQKEHELRIKSYAQTAASEVNLIKTQWAKVDFSIKKKGKGVSPDSLNNGPSTADATSGNLTDGKDKADSISKGGQRAITINIGKQIERLEMHVVGKEEAANEIARAVREELVRVFYSLNGATNG